MIKSRVAKLLTLAWFALTASLYLLLAMPSALAERIGTHVSGVRALRDFLLPLFYAPSLF